MIIQITTGGLYTAYGIAKYEQCEVITRNAKGNIFYVHNKNHDPREMPPKTSAWVAVHHTECEQL